MADELLLKEILGEIKHMRTDISDLKSDVSGLKTDVSKLKDDVADIKTKQQEDHQILRALEHKSLSYKTENEAFYMDIEKIKEQQKDIYDYIDAIKDILGRHEVDITILKNRTM